MKISKLFHWLYASLMFLPFVSVVSTSLYYAFNKNAVIPQIDKEISKEVEFNQVLENGNFVSNVGWYAYYSNLQVLQNNAILVTSSDFDGSLNRSGFTYDIGNTYYISFYAKTSGSTDIRVGIDLLDSSQPSYQIFNNVSTTTEYQHYSFNFVPVLNSSNNFGLVFRNYAVTGSNMYLKNIWISNLTKMFGLGNEPLSTEMDFMFPLPYYEYNLGEHIVIPNYETIQVADNSINHFWLPSFGAIGYNIENTITWVLGSLFGLNVANGIGYVIVKLFTYWLIISIVWLLFDLLMYVPNLVHRWLDKGAIE